MSLDYGTLKALRRHHPAWRLLAAERARLVAGFLTRAVVARHFRPSNLVCHA